MSGPWEQYQQPEATNPTSEGTPQAPWEQYAPNAQDSGRHFTPDSVLGTSQAEVVGRNLAQGATANFGDELQAVAEKGLAYGSKLTGVGPQDVAQRVIDRPTSELIQENRNELRETEQAQPEVAMGSRLLGSTPMMIATSGLGPVTQGAVLGGVEAAGAATGGVRERALPTAIGAGVGAAFGYAGDKISKLISGEAAPMLQKVAENNAERATGATGAQAMKFNEGAGRELLDQGIVSFGDTQASIASKAAGALDASGQRIGAALQKLDEMGARAPKQMLINKIDDALLEIQGDPAMAPVRDQLIKMSGEVAQMPQNIPLGMLEKVKRNFQALSNYNDPASKQATKIMARAFQETTEDVANKISPEIGALFKADKEAYGLMSPIAEAAEKRAAANIQRGVGGVSVPEVAAIGAATAMGHPGALAYPLLKEGVKRYGASTVAVGADKIAGILRATPEKLGRFAGPLTTALQRGLAAFHAAWYVLSKQPGNEDLRKLIEEPYDQDDSGTAY